MSLYVVADIGPGTGPPLRVLAAGTLTTPGLAAGTRVQLREGAGLKGTVMSYQRECLPGLLGLFPVRLDNAIWQTCHANDVIVLAPSTQTPPVGRSPHGGEEVTSLSE